VQWEKAPPGFGGPFFTGFLAGVRPKPLGAFAVAELGHHLALDLADPLAGQPEELADLVEGARLAVIEAATAVE